MAEILDLLTTNDWRFRADIPDDIWDKMQSKAEIAGETLVTGAGGSVIYRPNNTSNSGSTLSTTLTLNDTSNQRAIEARTDPLKFSKAKYHGYIKNLVTQEIRKFQFNPESFSYSRGVTYTDSISPGMTYPETQFSHGNVREFDIELFMYDPYCTGIIKEYMSFLGAFLTPETNVPNYTKPPEMLFYYGYFIRRCVLTNLNIVHEWLDEQGTPLMTRYQLTLRQVGVDEI